MEREELLARTFVELADTLVTGLEVADFLHLLARRSVEVVGIASAGVMLHDSQKGLRVIASSDEQMHAVQLLEAQASEGPCLDAFRLGTQIQALGAAARDRWPVSAPRALAAGYQLLGAVPMRLRDQSIGALGIFRTEPQLLSPTEALTAQAIADLGTICLLQGRALRGAQQLAEQLQTALHSRVTIEQAKGMLAERAGLTTDDAFAALRRSARNTNRRLVDVARDVVNKRLDATAVLDGHSDHHSGKSKRGGR